MDEEAKTNKAKVEEGKKETVTVLDDTLPLSLNDTSEGSQLQEDGLGDEDECDSADIKDWTQALVIYLEEAKEDTFNRKVSSILKREDDSTFLLHSLEHESRNVVSAALDLMEELMSMGANRKLLMQEHPDIIGALDTIRSCGDMINSRDAETMYGLLQAYAPSEEEKEKEPPLPEYIQDDEDEFSNNPGAVWYKNEDKSDQQSVFGKFKSFWQDNFYW